MTRRARPAARTKAATRDRGLRTTGALGASIILLLVLITFCCVTRWGRTYARFASGSWAAVRMSRGMSAEDRQLALYDDTFPVLLYLREYLPEDAKVLLPPIDFVRSKRGGGFPLLAGAASTYSFIYPRVPVHYGRPSPFKKQLTHVLVWEHWGLDYVAPGESETEGNRIMLYDWPEGMEASW
jgi:hypothetical protein